ncbi:MAG: D-amino acid aminotransferase [Gammaproteobacteria bacterium]
MNDTVYLNGVYGPATEAKVSVFDRGFLFGDGVYEVMPFYQGRAFGWEGHMERFERSLGAIDIPNPHTERQWRDIATQLLAANGDTQLIYLQVTRGVAVPRKHTYDQGMTPTVFASSISFTPVQTSGMSVITLLDERWEHCHIKSLNLLPNVLATQQAKREGVPEAILIHDGFVTEGASSNVFIVKNNEIFTPPTDGSILRGVTRGIICDLCASLGYRVKEEPISIDALINADEVWLSSVGKEITPVIKIDGQPIANGKPGPVWERAYPMYQECIKRDAHAL